MSWKSIRNIPLDPLMKVFSRMATLMNLRPFLAAIRYHGTSFKMCQDRLTIFAILGHIYR